MAVAADDGVHSGHCGSHIGVDIGINLDAAWLFGEADMRQGDYGIVGWA
jgi:hypothetical protein